MHGSKAEKLPSTVCTPTLLSWLASPMSAIRHSVCRQVEVCVPCRGCCLRCQLSIFKLQAGEASRTVQVDMTFLQECMSTTIPHTFSLEHKQEVIPPDHAVTSAIISAGVPALYQCS